MAFLRDTREVLERGEVHAELGVMGTSTVRMRFLKTRSLTSFSMSWAAEKKFR